MFGTLRRDAAFSVFAGAALLMAATPALSQGPSEAQKEAVKSQCRSDYMAHCSSVPPGGEASIQCLAKNMSSLSAGCAGAVRAIEAAAAPKTETAPAAAAPAKQSAPAAAAPAKETAPAAAAKPATATAAPKEASKAPGPRRDSRPARRSTRSRAPAAPTIQKSAPAFRPAARRHWNVWKRTRQRFRPAAKKRLRPPPAAQHPQRARRQPLRRLPLQVRHRRQRRP